MNLKKLGLLGDLAKEIFKGKISLEEVVLHKLPDIQEAQNPFHWTLDLVLGWMAAAAGVAMVLGGTKPDVIVAPFAAAIAWGTGQIFQRLLPPYFATWTMAVSAFLPAILITAVKIRYSQINLTIAILSAVAIPLPGYTVSLGLAELAANRVNRGAAHIIAGILTLLWLALGGYLGVLLVAAISGDSLQTTQPTENDMISDWWLFFFIPLLGVALNIASQISLADFFPAFFVALLSYAVSYGASYFTNQNVATFLSATISTSCANGWCLFADKPQPIILTPAIIFLVSGGIGLRGIALIISQDDPESKSLGAAQFSQMFLVALLISFGVLAGNTLVRPDTTL